MTWASSLPPVAQAVPTAALRRAQRSRGRNDTQSVGVAHRSKRLFHRGRDVTVTPSDGDCPFGTVAYIDLDRRTAGTQSFFRLRRGKRARGSLALVVRSDAFTSYSDEAPRRCTAVLTAASPGMDIDPSNNTTRVVIDVVDKNDY